MLAATVATHACTREDAALALGVTQTGMLVLQQAEHPALSYGPETYCH